MLDSWRAVTYLFRTQKESLIVQMSLLEMLTTIRSYINETEVRDILKQYSDR